MKIFEFNADVMRSPEHFGYKAVIVYEPAAGTVLPLDEHGNWQGEWRRHCRELEFAMKMYDIERNITEFKNEDPYLKHIAHMVKYHVIYHFDSFETLQLEDRRAYALATMYKLRMNVNQFIKYWTEV